MHESHQEEHPKEWGIKSKTITNVFDKFMNEKGRNLERLGNYYHSTAPGTIRTAVGRVIWSKILGKTCVKKLVNNCGCSQNCAMFSRKPKQFLKHRSYIGVSTGV